MGCATRASQLLRSPQNREQKCDRYKDIDRSTGLSKLNSSDTTSHGTEIRAKYCSRKMKQLRTS